MVAAVAAKGYAATTVADVLARARVSRSAFYEQFRDKEDCFLACYESGTSLVLEAVTTAFDAGVPWRQRMRGVFQSLLETFAQHPDLAKVCMVDALAAGPAANDRYRSAIAGLVLLGEKDMIGRADVPPAPRLVFLSLIGGISMILYDLTRLWLAGFVGYARVGGDPTATESSRQQRAD